MIIICGLSLLLLVGCHTNRAKSFDIIQPFMQRVNIEGVGSDSVVLYLVSIKVKPIEEVFSTGYSYWFTDGIMDSVENIKILDMNKNDQTEKFKGYSECKGKELNALWLKKTFVGDVFQVYNCANINDFMEELNEMSIDLRCEYSNKADSSIYINRLFAIPKNMSTGALTLKMKLKSKDLECRVNERPLKLQVYHVSYSR